MKNSTLNKLAEKLTKAFISNKLINPLPSHCTKKLKMLRYLENYAKVK